MKKFYQIFFAVVALIAPFYKILFFEDRALLYRDISRHFLAGKSFWANEVRLTGEIPYWNFYSYGGMPFWSENVNSPLHPLNWIFLAFRPENYPLAMNYFIWAHYFLLFVGGYFLAKALKCSDSLRLLLGTFFCLGGVSLSAHNISHSLFSFMIVPYFFTSLIVFLKSKKKLYLVLLSICISWPIYAGDPQFTYLMALIVSFSFLYSLGINPKSVILVVAIGLMSFLFSAVQLLPTLEMAALSSRGLDLLSVNELLSFSFHPMRLLEILWPQFYGNQYGFHVFWGTKFINFAHKSPFLFSLYSGAMIFPLYLFSLINIFISKNLENNREKIFIHLGIVICFFICFGAFSPLPIYEFLVNWFPYFNSFRYPERLLFWPSILLWLLFVIEIPSFYRSFMGERAKFLAVSVLVFCLLSYFLGFSFIYLGFIKVPVGAYISILTAAIFLLLHFICILFVRVTKIGLNLYLVFVLGLILLELSYVQNKLVWDQSKYITDSKRYDSHLLTLKKIEELKSSNQARKFTSIYLGGYQFQTGVMDHTTFTTFASYEALVPNIPMSVGIEDVFGYYALAPKEKVLFWQMIASRDEDGIEKILDIMGVRFRPTRTTDQKILLTESNSASPYLYIAEKVIPGESFEKDLNFLMRNASEFKKRDAIILDSKLDLNNEEPGVIENKIEIKRRDGRGMNVEFKISSNFLSSSYLIWNESYDKHWRAYVDGKPLDVYRANAWAMAVKIPKEIESGVLEFRYENPLITIGKWITGLSFFGFFLYGGFLFMQGHIQKRKNRSTFV